MVPLTPPGARPAPDFPTRPMVWLFLVAGGLGLLSVAVPHDPVTDDRLVAGVSVVALLVAAVLSRRGRLGPTGLSAGLATGTLLASVAIYATGGPPNASSALYTWICLYAAYALSMRSALAHAVGCALAYGLLVVVAPPDFPPVAHWTTAAGSLIGATALVAHLRRRLDRTVERLVDVARTDPLTGLPNRRHLSETLAGELDRAARHGRAMAVLVCDIDRFKLVNDTYGHSVGDQVLVTFAEVLRDGVRTFDVAGRLGGEEFAVILPDTDTDAAAAVVVAERLRRETTQRLATLGLAVTVSFGVASGPGHGRSPSELLAAADRALYAAKRSGRDRTVRYDLVATEELLRGGPQAADRVEALLLLAESLDLRDASTAAHSRTVGAMCAGLAASMGFDDDAVARVRLAGVLHDIGKLAVPDAILQKPGPLTDEERRVIERHPELGARLLEGAGLSDVSEWVRSHHERVDGTGYPRGLPVEAIPMEARILAVADAYEAMTADRAYSPPMEPATALAELERCAGTQFDVAVVDHLVALTAEGLAAGSD